MVKRVCREARRVRQNKYCQRGGEWERKHITTVAGTRGGDTFQYGSPRRLRSVLPRVSFYLSFSVFIIILACLARAALRCFSSMKAQSKQKLMIFILWPLPPSSCAWSSALWAFFYYSALPLASPIYPKKNRIKIFRSLRLVENNQPSARLKLCMPRLPTALSDHSITASQLRVNL